jgi:hypothetical protein
MIMIIPCRILTILALSSCILLADACQPELSCETCSGPNKPPIANAGTDQAISLPKDSTLLDGSASKDPDGIIKTWSWKKIGGPDTGSIRNPSQPTTIIHKLRAGQYLFELSVTDDRGLVGKDTVAVQVTKSGSPNQPPVAVAGPDQLITLNTGVANLDGSASYDPDNNITSFLWSPISGPAPVNIAQPTSTKTQVQNLVEGIYKIQLKVTDAEGLFSMDTVQLQIITVADRFAPCVSGRQTINAQLNLLGSLSEQRARVLVASAGGKIIFASGYNGSADGSNNMDVYDVASGTWSMKFLSSPHLEGGVAVSGNKVFLAGGGYVYADYFPTIDIYDVATNSLSRMEFSEPKTLVAGAAVGNKVLFAGGEKISGDHFPFNIETQVESYDLLANTWQKSNLSEGRSNIIAVTCNEKVFFAGGSTTKGVSKTIDIYDDQKNSWAVSQVNYLNMVSAGIALGNNIYFTDTGTCQVEIMNANTGSSRLESLSRKGFVQSVLYKNLVVFLRFGSRYFDIYDPVSSEWKVGQLPQALPFGAAVIAYNNFIYVAGGTAGCQDMGNGSCTPIYTNQVWRLEF